MKIKSFLVVGTLSTLLFGTVLGFNYYKEGKIKEALANLPEISVPVTTEIIKYKNYIPKVEGVGFIVSGKAVNISNELSGKIVEINFESGQNVKEGDSLLKLDTKLEVAELKKTEARMPAVKSKYDRYNYLIKNKSISKEDLEESRSEYLSLVAEIETLKAKIDLKNITAPFDGIVGIRHVNLGEYLSTGSDIVRLENIDVMSVKIAISQKNYLDVKIGQKVKVLPESINNKIYEGKVSAISPVINPNTGLFEMEITIPNDSKILRTGMYSTVIIDITEKENQIIIPQTSIKYALYGQSVFVVNKSEKEELRVEQKFVKTDELIDDDIVILEGLSLGDRVVTNGQLKLNNGSLIFESEDKTLQNMKIINNL